VNSAGSLAAGLPVGRHAVGLWVVAAYALPAVITWAPLGLGLGALGQLVPGLQGAALAAVAAYGLCYGLTELSGRLGPAPPGRSWQVPQTMLLDAPPRRRLLVWGALLGPGFATRNPFAGFGLLPLAVAAMPGAGAGVALGATIGLAHGTARAAALLRDVRELGREPAGAATLAVAGGVPGAAAAEVLPTHLDMVLKTIYWRRFDGAVLLAVAATGLAACVRYVT
jgi:hypothetical protein